jgi:3-hydroxyacyl-CoA dehydrogenase
MFRLFATRRGAAVAVAVRSGSFRSFGAERSGKIRTVGVVGLGQMGIGITQAVCAAGYNVIVTDTVSDVLLKSKGKVERCLKKNAHWQVQKGRIEEADVQANVQAALDRITQVGKDNWKELSKCDLIIEAITENLSAKLQVMDALGSIASNDAILASNTSTFCIRELAGRPQTTLGLHFFHPVPGMRLVEVVQTDMVDPAVVETVCSFVRSLGKHPVQCQDTPGFIVNRLLIPSLSQAMLMLDRGDADIEAIDTAMVLGASHKMGPFALADFIGLDTVLSLLAGWRRKHDDPTFQIPTCLQQKVARGQLGRKNGHGFYMWVNGRRIGVAV